MDGSCQIIISRPGINGPARVYTIEHDGFVVGKLGVNSELCVPTTPGNHMITFSAFGKQEKALMVNVPEQNPIVRMSAKLNVMGRLEVSYGGYMADSRASQKRKHPILKGIGILILIIIILSALFGESDNDGSSSHANDVQKTIEDKTNSEQIEIEEEELVIELSAHDLWFAYDENEVNADNLYKKKTICVTGTVFEIGKDLITDTPFIALKAGDSLGIYAVQCFFQDSSENEKIASVKNGDTISIVGTCNGKSINVMLRDCSIKAAE